MAALISILAAALIALGALAPYPMAHASPGAEEDHHENAASSAADNHEEDAPVDLDDMREMHREHAHEHDFEAIERLSPERMSEFLSLLREVGLALPPMDPARGRELFLEKGCVACHSVSGVGGGLGPSLAAEDMPKPMNAFEFAARMWRGAPAMAAMQQGLLGRVITLDGQELADLIAFAHDAEEQAKLDASRIPPEFRELIGTE